MGDYYEIIWLAGIPYIEFMNEASKWQTVAHQLTKDQCNLLDNFECQQSEDLREFLKGLSEQ